jgi:hypothetical protein
MATLTAAAAAEPAVTKEPPMIRELTHAEIETRAYYRYVERGCLDGFDVDDWLAAEVELRPDIEALASVPD